MKLKAEVIEKINENLKCKRRIRNYFDLSDNALRNWLRANEDDGDLTKQSALEIISEELKIVKSKILENHSTEKS